MARLSGGPFQELGGTDMQAPAAVRFNDDCGLGVLWPPCRTTRPPFELAAGEHPKVVQELLGHSTMAVTMAVYSHVIPSLKRDAADRMGALLEAARTAS